MPNFYTTKEVATKLHKSPKTIRSWIAKGDLKAVLLPDGTYLVPEESIHSIFRNAHPSYDILG
jgi:excisionase family DNA binding protein